MTGKRMNARPSKYRAKPKGMAFDKQCEYGSWVPVPTPEHRFHPKRKWRFDYAWPDLKLAMEVEGGAFVAGRHTRGAGFVKDMEKYSEAAILGWRLLRVTPKQVQNGEALALVERAVRMVA